jgi:pimeloyl-ACP methyl ester carboxylesterase
MMTTRFRRRFWDAVLPRLPGVIHHRFDESGHTPQLEEPERLDDVLLGWLRETRKG